MFSVARSAGFASCKTFGKQPKRPCFGRSPKAGRRDASPVFSPFPGKGGQGDRDSKLEVYFKNRLFLQAESRELQEDTHGFFV